MRQAPVWRRWIPTARQIRFFVQLRIARLFPEYARKYNFYSKQSDLSEFSQKIVAQWKDESECALNEAQMVFLQQFADLEKLKSKTGLRIDGVVEGTLYKLSKCYVLGHSGSSIIRGDKSQVEDLQHNTARFRKLETVHLNGTVSNFLGLPKGHKHYYMFISHILPQFIRLCEEVSGNYDKITVLVRSDLSSFQRNIFSYLQKLYPFLEFAITSETERYACENLIFLSEQRANNFRSPPSRISANKVSAYFKRSYGILEGVRPYRKIYVSRRDARIRRILNEEQLEKFLLRKGFDIICPGELSHPEQVKIFNEAKVIIGAHGAGLTNILFSQSGGVVLELLPRNYVQSAYMWISVLKNQSYTPILCELGGAHQHFSVSAKAFMELERTLDGIQCHPISLKRNSTKSDLLPFS
ncbi:glycosyltransferase family 61 protein [Flexibacterium corallicola]|uniref:glycosyltransferase family 61 protein n=1 Tax=Flexibacterium corallicola TaxID=3037259 RepID=UPI00286EC03E|nr:glycosyltransferase family 61 protein [Pseudovibrio sp. M1P-2-3]